MWIGYFVGGDDPWPHGAVAIDAFAFKVLFVLGLQVTGGDIVEDGITKDVVEGLFLANIFAGSADDDGQLCLPVNLLRDGGIDDNIARWPIDGGGSLGEDNRILG